MLYLRLRFLLIGLFLVVGVVLYVQMGIWAAVPPLSAALLMIASYFLLGTVGPAFSKLKKGKITEAQSLIDLNYFPNLLLKRHKAYYHFVIGMLSLQHNQREQSKEHFEKSLEIGLRNENDKGFATLNLAHIKFVDGDYAQSREYLKRCKEFQTNDLMLNEKIEELEVALSKQ